MRGGEALHSGIWLLAWRGGAWSSASHHHCLGVLNLEQQLGRIFLNSKLLDAVTVYALSDKTLREWPEAVLVVQEQVLPGPVSAAHLYSI